MVLLSTLFTSTTDVIFKYASAGGTIWQYFVLRSLLAIPVLLAIAFLWGDGAATWSRALRLWPMLRALLFVLMFIATYAALPVLPLATLAAGLYTSPLFVAALSALLTAEAVGWRGWFAIALGFAGVLLILRPGTEAFTWFTLLPVLGGLLYALSALVTRGKCRAIPPATLAVALNIALVVMGAAASALLFIWTPAPPSVAASPFLLGSWQVLGPLEWGFVAILAALMVGNSLVVSAAYQSAPPFIIATFDYNYLIFMTAFGFIVFSEVPDRQTVVGMLMIVGAGMMVVRR
ncbi:MAG TPA: DMT family transporter [Candidatus Angelobacter sp.]|nr:DMT family transporter [Candidatus Angelobacter sp.]